MTFLDWFLIQAPSIRTVMEIKVGVLAAFLFFCVVGMLDSRAPDNTKRIAKYALAYLIVIATAVAFIPNRDESDRLAKKLEGNRGN